MKIGYDGIVFATDIAGPDWKLMPADVYKALAAKIVVDGKLVDNPNTKWNQVNPALPDWDIAAYIPGEKHGTREVFETKLLEAGCDKDGLTAAGVAKEELFKTCVASARTARLSTSTATTPRRSPASTRTRPASACSASPSTRTMPTS